MDPTTRNQLQRATQDARRLLEAEFAAQLEGTYDILPDGRILPEPGAHLDDRQRLIRGEIIAAIEHIRCKEGGKTTARAIDDYRREAAFTFLNRFAALKMLEARGLVQQCVSKGDQSGGFKEFTGLAPGLSDLPDKGYQLYLECLFDELGAEVNVLFDRRDPASLLWPRRQALLDLLEVLNRPELAGDWGEDEAIGWVYQYFNSQEERRAMRDASAAPRNSRELAVRNQFFTPRYVVEFLTDNTLGRIWYEMRRGRTALANDCRFLVRRPNEVFLAEGEAAPAAPEGADSSSRPEQRETPDYILHRSAKDPRDLKILDPACGSGHFLLYGFDLLLTIYREAWEDETSPKSEQTGTSLREEYPTLEDLHLEIPGLILRHNLHGIDIDPRCAQIAALALWMRAQRAFNDLGIGRDRRKAIRKTNIVVAEPMPGERDMLDEFLRSLREDRLETLMRRALDIPEGQRIRATKAMADSLCQLVEAVWEKMKLAGEAGCLLKIEEELAAAIEKGRDEWEEKLPLFRVTEYSIAGRSRDTFYRHLPGGDHDFWDKAETLAILAIGEIAAESQSSDRFRRSLFAEDSSRGFAFIDILNKSFDAILMNPPFGEKTPLLEEYVKAHYNDAKNDIYASFVLRATELVERSRGRVGALTSRSFVSGRDHRLYRRKLLTGPDLVVELFLDLGSGVLEGAAVETAAYVMGTTSGCFMSYIDARNRPFSEMTPSHFRALDVERFDRRTFTNLPGCDLLFKLGQEELEALSESNTLEPGLGRVTFGLTTKDDSRFVRLRWEVPETSIGVGNLWVPFSKGGEYSWFSGDTHLVVKQNTGAEEIAAFAKTRDGNVASTRRSSSYYFRPCITYSRRSQKGFSARRLRAGVCFSDKSAVIVLPPENRDWLIVLPFVFASIEYQRLINSQSTFGCYEVGPMKRLPVPDGKAIEYSDRFLEVYRLVDQIDKYDETCLLFERPAPHQFMATEAMDVALELTSDALDNLGYELDEVVSRNQRGLAKEKNSEIKGLFAWISYAIGILFGRWSGSMMEFPALTLGPFDPIGPRTSLSEARTAEMQNILVDDVGHRADIAQNVYDQLAGLVALESWGELGIPNHVEDLRHSISRFFDYHLGRYSKSNRQAPIYWPLSSSRGHYTIWLYYHRFRRDTLFSALNDFARPRLQHERLKLARLQAAAGPQPTRVQREAVEEQESLVSELEGFVEELAWVAPLWDPDLNDGVIINFAPLWRLIGHTGWRKSVRDCWESLCAGDYDWSHLAMHLWPERVVPKCVEDASLAIAHGLEDAFWERDARDRWVRKAPPSGGWRPEIDRLVAERISSAVKSALESLLNAPAPVGKPQRRRRGKTDA